MSSKEYNFEKKYKLVAPEGGWGYLIAVAAVVTFATTTMFQGSFGILYNDFMKDIGMESTHLTMMLGISAMCSSMSGFFTSPLLSIMSIRLLAFLSATLFNIGMIGTVFVNTIFHFIICVGILQATGLGILFNLFYTILYDYFVTRRLMILGVTQTLVAIAAMIAPIFSKWSLEEYGYRGTMLLISGLSMNNFFAVAIIQPVEQHMKKVEILENEMKTLLDDETSQEKHNSTPVIKLSDIEANVLKNNEKASEDMTANPKSNYLNKIVDLLFDKSLRTTYLLSSACLGPALSVFSDLTFMYMLPQALYTAKWEQNDVTLAISVMSFGDLAMRIVLIFFSTLMLKLGSEVIYILGVVVALVSRLGMLWSKSLIWNLIYLTLAGAAHCGITILGPVVVADVVPHHKFTSAMGILSLTYGLTNLILAPAIGAVRDLSKSYGAAFYLLASCFAIVILFWSIELYYKRNLDKRIQRKEFLKQKKLNRG